MVGCQAGAVFHRKSGLGTLPLALFNGVPLSPEEMDPDELETIILQRIMDATNFYQRAVFMVPTVWNQMLVRAVLVYFLGHVMKLGL